RDQPVAVDREPVLLGFALKSLVDPGLPVDQGAVDLEAHKSQVLGESHEPPIRFADSLPRRSDMVVIPAAGAVDLLEYQGKQLFAKSGIPVPDGRRAVTPLEAREAAEALGFPVVV